MIGAFLLCVVLIVLAPLAIIWDGPVVQGLLLIAAAATTVDAALYVKPGQFRFAISTLFLAGIAAAVPAFWMVIQILPLGVLGLDNPIWKTAAAVLGSDAIGSISIDGGATLVSLARYLGFVAIVFATTVIAVDRVRASQLYLGLAIAACMTGSAGIAACLTWGSLAWLSKSETAFDAILNCAVPGALLCAALLLQPARRSEASGRISSSSGGRTSLGFFVAIAGFLLCLAALLLSRSAVLGIITAVGIAIVVMVNGLRRFGSGPAEIAAVISIILFVIVAGGALKPEIRSVGATLAFASRVPPPMMDASRRMIGDAGWAGSGAGTFAYALSIHRDVRMIDAGSAPPTAAAMIGVEMGETFLWVIMLAALAVILQLLRGATKRGRDWVYPSAGAACLTAALLQSFTNAAVVSSAFFVILAVVIGMALAQSKSRSPQQES